MRRGRAISPIGLEVGSRWLRAAQLAREKDAWRLHAWAALPRAQGTGATLDEEARRLAGVLERRGFAGCDIVMAVPPEKLLGSVLELPPRASGAPIEQLAAAELARIHHIDAAALEVALWEVPATNRTGAGCQYMVAACPHEAATALLDPFEEAGLVVRALDLRQLALLRACAHSIRPAPSMDALLHVGWDQCALLIVTDGVVNYERPLEGAEGRALVGVIAQRLGMEPHTAEDLLLRAVPGAPTPAADPGAPLENEVRELLAAHFTALVEQLNISFSYISRQYRDRELEAVLVTGEFGALPGLAGRIASLNVSARVVRAPDTVRVAGGAEEPELGPGLIACIGLAMHQERAAA